MTLQVRNVSKTYGLHRALGEVSFKVAAGEIASIAGESGCGKSTLLRIIAGLEPSDSGSVFLNNIDISSWKPEKRNFGFVFQNLALFPHLTVAENLTYAHKRSKGLSQEVKQLMDITGITGLEKRYPHELSGGQQQRVALARALSIQPRLLILDEPFSSLDELIKARIREEIFDIIRSLSITTLFVSHQPADAFLIADKLIVMQSGKVLQSGTPKAIYERPESVYVSRFFGSSVIMKIKSRVDGYVETAFGRLPLSPPNNHQHVFLRPEKITIHDEEKENYHLKGKLVKKEFKGPHDVLWIVSENATDQIRVETERCTKNVGDTIYLQLSPASIQTLP